MTQTYKRHKNPHRRIPGYSVQLGITKTPSTAVFPLTTSPNLSSKISCLLHVVPGNTPPKLLLPLFQPAPFLPPDMDHLHYLQNIKSLTNIPGIVIGIS